MIKNFNQFTESNIKNTDIIIASKLLLAAVNYDDIIEVSNYLNIPYKIFYKLWQGVKIEIGKKNYDIEVLVKYLALFGENIGNNPSQYKGGIKGLGKLNAQDTVFVAKITTDVFNNIGYYTKEKYFTHENKNIFIDK